MKVVLLRVGIDTGAGGMHGPLIDAENHYEYIPIPDDKYEIDERTYGETNGMLRKQPLIEYFPKKTQEDNANKPIHYDPEFETFTYGDPTSLKGRLRELEKGDLLIFYCGLEGFGGGHRQFEFELPRFGERDRPFRFEFGGADFPRLPDLGELRGLSPEELHERIEEQFSNFDGNGRFEFRFGDGDPFHFDFGDLDDNEDDDDDPSATPILNRAA